MDLQQSSNADSSSDYEGRSWIAPPKDAKASSDHCCRPTILVHRWSGHTRGTHALVPPQSCPLAIIRWNGCQVPGMDYNSTKGWCFLEIKLGMLVARLIFRPTDGFLCRGIVTVGAGFGTGSSAERLQLSSAMTEVYTALNGNRWKVVKLLLVALMASSDTGINLQQDRPSACTFGSMEQGPKIKYLLLYF